MLVDKKYTQPLSFAVMLLRGGERGENDILERMSEEEEEEES